MKTLTISVLLFINITTEDCLNYNNVNPKLESLIKAYIENYFKKKEIETLTTNEDIEAFLEHMLLRISGNSIWLKLQQCDEISQKYLYTIIRKYLFLYKPEIRF
ncbi:hypothetical protein [Petrocella sp. FN5]|uniref:hypothetical protein n=1 Tax=Petrocella sp. FN5 TaxID=3032002 RepID=UPI0023DC1AA8|nr:hypothetical protein [Petrocella sp. FN5]MDF1617313.1 hypothetical protein [Petrocella sp. FN5]